MIKDQGMKRKFFVEIVETLRTEIPVWADDSERAIDEVEKRYRNQEIILSSEDIVDTTIDFSDKNICECKEPRYWGNEMIVVEGMQYEGELLIKSRDTEGVDDLRCEKCGMKPDSNLEWVFV